MISLRLNEIALLAVGGSSWHKPHVAYLTLTGIACESLGEGCTYVV